MNSVFLRLIARSAVVGALAWMLIAVAAVATLPLIPSLNNNTDSADLLALLTPPDGCPMPCWAGIRVGVTTRADAEAILGAHPWVGRVFSGATQLSWRWNGTQPALIDGARDGLIGLGAGVVQRLRIQTTVRYGEMWGALGAPDDALLVRPVSRYAAFQISMYDFERPNALMVISSFGCPVTPREFWTSTTTLGMGDVWTTEALNGIRFDIYEQPGWWGRLRRCRSGLAR